MTSFAFFTDETDNVLSQLIQLDAQRQADQARRVHYAAADLAALEALWRPAATLAGQDATGARFTLPNGDTFHVSPTRIERPENFSHAWFRASMHHAETQWGGRLSIGLDDSLDPTLRLWARAYAEVYGVELCDVNEGFLPLQLKAADLARLPEMRRQIRAMHSDAPPQRPDEAAELAAMYARRYPFRRPAAA